MIDLCLIAEFLELLFNNIAEWVEEDMHWRFKSMRNVKGQGEKLDEIQNRARREQAEASRKKREAEEAAEAEEAEKERLVHERRTELRAQQALKDKRNARDEFFKQCKSRLQALDDEEAEILRRLAAGDLSPEEEEEELRRRLPEIAQEGIGIRMEMLEYERNEMMERLMSGGLTAEEEEEIRRGLAALEQMEFQLRIDRLDAEETELLRKLASGMLSPEEEEEIRRIFYALQQERAQLRIGKLDAEQSEMQRRIATGYLFAEEEAARRRLGAIVLEKVSLKLSSLDAEETELRRKLESGMLSAEVEFEYEMRLKQLGKDRLMLQLEALQVEKDEWQRRLATGLMKSLSKSGRHLSKQVAGDDVQRKLAAFDDEEAELSRRLAAGGLTAEEEAEIRARLPVISAEREGLREVFSVETLANVASGLSPEEEEEEHARERLKWIEEERKRLLNKSPPTFVTVQREEVIRDVTTSQVRFSRKERVKRMQTRREIQMGKIKRKEEAEKVAAHQQRKSPAAQRQAERWGQRAAKAAAAARAVQEEEEMRHWQSMGESGGGNGGGHASYVARARQQQRRHDRNLTESQEWRSSVAGVDSSYNSQRALEEEEADATVLRPGRTSPRKRQIGFGRPKTREKFKPIVAGKKPGHGAEQAEATEPKLTRAQKKQLREQKRQQRRWLEQQEEQAHSVRRSRSLPNWPERDNSWRQSTFDSGSPARGLATPPGVARMWYAEDDTRRFVKGPITKGYLPPVGSPGSLNGVAGTRVA